MAGSGGFRLSTVVSMALVAAGLMAGAVPAGAGTCPPEKYVLGIGRAFTAASHSGSGTAFLSAANRFANTRAIAMSAIGPYRSKLGGREGEYVRLAQGYMGRFMAKYSSSLNATGMKVTLCQGNTVTTTTASGRKIIFRVSGGGGSYQLQDVNVSSIWLAGQMRSTFTRIIKNNNGDVGALLSFLKG